MQNLAVVIYARVSSKEQHEEGYSIDAQLRLLRVYAAKNNFKVVKEYVDIETAKQSGRTNFNQMVEFLKRSSKQSKTPCRIILVEKTDRLYRNFRDYVTVDEIDVDCHFVKDNQVLSKDSRSTEKFIHGIKVLMAKNYCDNLSEEAKKGMNEKAQQGIWPSRAPLGYINVERNGKKVIEVDPRYAPLIKQIYEWYVTGMYSVQEVTKMAHAAGLVYPTSKAKVPQSTVHKILRNPLYTGDIEWDGKYYKGQHQPIVTRALFDEVQTIFRERGKHKPRHRRYFWAFTGLVSCGHCGAAYTCERKKGRFIYYRCSFSRQKCKEPYVREEVLAEAFGRALEAIKLDNETLRWLVEALKNSHAEEKKFHDGVVKGLQEEVRTLQRRLHNMYLDYLDNKVLPEFYESQRAEWNRQIETALENIGVHESADRSYLVDGADLLELVQRMISLYEKQDSFEKRKLLSFVVSNSSWKDGKLTVTFKKPFDLLVVTKKETEALGGSEGSESERKEKWLGR